MEERIDGNWQEVTGKTKDVVYEVYNGRHQNKDL